MPFEFFRKGKGEIIGEHFSLRLKKDEKSFVISQSEIECTSINGLIRKAIKQYQLSVKTKPE